jgi:DNA-binding winged helix-turn-helix (wHTH) protein/tetratricopeptide (TPR) repeat protein
MRSSEVIGDAGTWPCGAQNRVPQSRAKALDSPVFTTVSVYSVARLSASPDRHRSDRSAEPAFSYHRAVATETYPFGEFVVDVAKREIVRRDQRVAVPAKVFDCVAYLIKHRDRAIGRDELISAVWGRADVTDNLLAQIVLRARRTFDDDSDAQRVIRTITGFGYRWVCPIDDAKAARPIAAAAIEEVRTETAAAAPVVERSESMTVVRVTEHPIASVVTTSARRAFQLRPAARLFAVLVVTIAVLAVGAHFLSSERHRTAAPKSLAFVLPATVRNAPEFAWARLGIMDFVAQRLREASQPTVPSETAIAIAKFAADAPTADELAAAKAATNATFFVALDIERSANSWRVRLSKLQGADQRAVFDGSGSDLLKASNNAVSQLLAAIDLVPPQFDEGTGAGATLAQELIATRLQGRLADARALVEREPQDVRDDPRVRFEIAALDFFDQRVDQARDALTTLVAEKTPDYAPDFKARVTTALATVANSQGRYADGERLATEAIDSIKSQDPIVVGNALGSALDNRAIARAALAQYDKAEDDFATARTVLTTTGNVPWLAVVDLNHATMQIARDRLADAAAELRDAAPRLRRFGLSRHALLAYGRLGLCDLDLQYFTAAAEDDAHIADAMTHAEDPRALALARIVRAETAAALGRVGDASTMVDALLADRTAADSARGPALMTDALLALDRGDATRAATSARASVAIKWDAERTRGYATAWLALARADRIAAQDRVADDVAHARAWAIASTRPAAARLVALIEAEHLAMRGDDGATRAAYERALRATADGAAPSDIVEVTTSYGNWLIGKRDFERAVAVLGRNHEWAESNFRVAVAEARLYRATSNQVLWRSAFERARKVAGERAIPPDIATFDGTSADATASAP